MLSLSNADTGYEDFAEVIPYNFVESVIERVYFEKRYFKDFMTKNLLTEQYGDLTYNKFIAAFNKLDVGMSSTLEEQFRVYKRECFLHGECRKFGRERSAARGSNFID